MTPLMGSFPRLVITFHGSDELVVLPRDYLNVAYPCLRTVSPRWRAILSM